jgi:hypothetical protein
LKERDLEVERLNSKYDFNRNGIEVPLMNEKEMNGSNTLLTKYEPFGNTGFNFSRTLAKQMQSNSSVSRLETKPTELYSKTKPKQRRPKTQMFCAFCKNNNETQEMYRSHILKDTEGKTVCPILQKYNCPICNNNGGEYAHTIRYCPLNKSGQCIPSVIKLLKNSRTSDGKRRSAF